MKLIDLYREWMELGTMGIPRQIMGGLCNQVPEDYKGELMLFEPDGADSKAEFWAYGRKRKNYKPEAYSFSPLRQTIVCFLMAMHNEI